MIERRGYHGGANAALLTSFGTGCAPSGPAPSLQSFFPLRIGASVLVTATSATAGPVALVFGAPDPLGTPLGGGCTPWLSNPVFLMTLVPGSPAFVGPFPPTRLGQEVAFQGRSSSRPAPSPSPAACAVAWAGEAEHRAVPLARPRARASRASYSSGRSRFSKEKSWSHFSWVRSLRSFTTISCRDLPVSKPSLAISAQRA